MLLSSQFKSRKCSAPLFVRKRACLKSAGTATNPRAHYYHRYTAQTKKSSPMKVHYEFHHSLMLPLVEARPYPYVASGTKTPDFLGITAEIHSNSEIGELS